MASNSEKEKELLQLVHDLKHSFDDGGEDYDVPPPAVRVPQERTFSNGHHSGQQHFQESSRESAFKRVHPSSLVKSQPTPDAATGELEEYDVPRPATRFLPEHKLEREPSNIERAGSQEVDSEYRSPKTPTDGVKLKYSFRGQSASLSTDRLHYKVPNGRGSADLYTRPSSKGTPPVGLFPPELPPRNTPSPSLWSSGAATEVETISSRSEGGFDDEVDGGSRCHRCGVPFEDIDHVFSSDGQLYHQACFACAQCFRPFPDGIFYEFEGRKYCEYDFNILYAPCCGKCGEFIIGRVIKALGASWHARCFTCEICRGQLADGGFAKVGGRAVCKRCRQTAKAGSGKNVGARPVCRKCYAVIEEDPLRFRGELFHAYHFQCAGCREELTPSAREVKATPGITANETNELYCLRCHDKMGIPVCAACKTPIEERAVFALGKNWHVEHFSCSRCERPFFGKSHFEQSGLAYCETHYHELFGQFCYVCGQVVAGDVLGALNKTWCVDHFACSSCDHLLSLKSKFYEVDLKPVCKKCFEKYPKELKTRLKAYDAKGP